MSVATTRDDAGPADAPIAPPRVLRQRRMRPGLFGLAILLVALGGLGAAFAVTSVRATDSYLAVSRAVPAGTQLTAEDLIAVQMAGGHGLNPIPADRIKEVLGKRATVRLTPGTLLTMAQVTDAPLLGPGQQQIALGLKPSQVPARKLRPGDKLLLISTPARGSGTTATSTRFEATVIDTNSPDRGDVVLYLAVAARDVQPVVVLAADNRIAVVLTGMA